MREFLCDPHLTDGQLKLLKEIEDEFRPEENAADLSILYEITGYQAEPPIGSAYWDSYEDFEAVLGTKALVNTKKDEKAWFHRKRKVNVADEEEDT